MHRHRLHGLARRARPQHRIKARRLLRIGGFAMTSEATPERIAETPQQRQSEAIRLNAEMWRARFDACRRVESHLYRLGINPDDLRDWLAFGDIP